MRLVNLFGTSMDFTSREIPFTVLDWKYAAVTSLYFAVVTQAYPLAPGVVNGSKEVFAFWICTAAVLVFVQMSFLVTIIAVGENLKWSHVVTMPQSLLTGLMMELTAEPVARLVGFVRELTLLQSAFNLLITVCTIELHHLLVSLFLYKRIKLRLSKRKSPHLEPEKDSVYAAENRPSAKPVGRKIAVGAIELNVAEICLLKSDGHYVQVHLNGGTTKLVRVRLTDICNMIDTDLGMRVHRSYWVAYGFIGSLEKNRLRLRDGTEVPVSISSQSVIANYIENGIKPVP